MSEESIIDASKPNAGRIYDYLLGGHHNFEVDRQAADRLVQLLPFIPKAARLQRWCLQDIAAELTQKRGYDLIIDYASGLPTNDHIHYIAPEGTTVIYSDYDPVVVEYAKEILKDTPNVYYFQADLRRPEELLNRDEVKDILKGRRKVAFVSWGVSAFLTDNDVAHVAEVLGDWSDAGSCWAFHAQGADANPNDPANMRVNQIYQQMGSPTYFRFLDQYEKLLQPWKPDENGYISLLKWHGFDESVMTEDDRKSLGPAGIGYGSYLIK